MLRTSRVIHYLRNLGLLMAVLVAAVLVLSGITARAVVETAPPLDSNNCASGSNFYYNNPASRIVVLDPGHGAEDPGAIASVNYNGTTVSLQEKTINLDIAFRAGKFILANNSYWQVCFTRVDDTANPTNTERADYANARNASALVLIHINSADIAEANYTKTYWAKKNKDLDFSTMMYNALWSGGEKDGLKYYNNNATTLTGGGLEQFASDAMLKSSVPSTLVESVFLSNPAEAVRLLEVNNTNFDGTVNTNRLTSRRQQIAEAISAGIKAYLQP